MASNLPSLPEIERLSPRVIRILGGNSNKFTLQGTNTYLLGTGASRILIDTAQGLPAWSSSLSKVLAQEQCTVSQTLLTHWHMDHVFGVPDLQALCPDSTIHKFPLPSPPPPGAPEFVTIANDEISPIVDGDVFRCEGATLKALHSPGHTVDHLAFVLGEEGGAMFAGDNVLGHGTAVFEDLSAYLKSLSLMRDECGEGARLYPGHGQVVENGRAKIEEYVAHRRKREEEIVAAMKGKGAITARDVVRIVYEDYPEALHEPAEGGVRQALAKLKGEGKVVEEASMWRLTEKAAL